MTIKKLKPTTPGQRGTVLVDKKNLWKEKSFNIHEGTHRITVKVQGSAVDYYNEWIKVPDTWKRKYEKIRSKIFNQNNIL